MRRFITSVFTLGIVVALPLLASAQTPDGQTPAVETVCDGESGAAFGLCNAYCEAMDCDSSPEASQTACDTVQDLFIAITGRDLPCEQPPCGLVFNPACAGTCPPGTQCQSTGNTNPCAAVCMCSPVVGQGRPRGR